MGGTTGKVLRSIFDPFGFTGETLYGVQVSDLYMNKEKDVDTSSISDQAAQIEQATKEAEANAELVAQEEAKKKRAQQTRTIFTSGLGLLGSNPETKKTTLGSN